MAPTSVRGVPHDHPLDSRPTRRPADREKIKPNPLSGDSPARLLSVRSRNHGIIRGSAAGKHAKSYEAVLVIGTVGRSYAVSD